MSPGTAWGIALALVIAALPGLLLPEHWLPVALFAAGVSFAVGSEFTGWAGACSGTGPCAFTLGEGAEVVANFARTRNDGGGAHSPRPPATPAPSLSAPAVRKAKKPLRCKVGFRKEKHKGKIRCVKAKPRHKGGSKAKGGRAGRAPAAASPRSAR
jgi:hypothetical protein